ncbi:uncharacterized protein BX664DRAFT_340014 [Halteromyces radiatus]|uniref:uncharacterized protein n=1 Tax=Halteromyces radiatus TaxID=101107 RepID=UPI0022211754|nr:uncharacterized protein BX664DRAFT_340014 [Halteromyces radiatus]KAI8081274.1 hypothetical protein BX664DRAFT_340014 [Halteromyces radiatus]
MAVDLSMSSRIMQFNSVQDELDYYRNHAENLENTLQETRAALDEFQVSSRELEEELEKELQTTEKAYKELKSQCERSRRDADEWKSKFTEAKHEQSITMMQMQREIDILRATEEMFRKKILELELDNDDLERTERAATSSLSDLEVKLNKAIERNVILENEIATKDNLTEQTQRLKDELNEVNQELAVLRTKSSKQKALIQDMETKLEIANKKSDDLQQQQLLHQQQHHANDDSSRSSTPDKTTQYYYESYNPRRSRIPRNGPSTTTLSSASTNPVKMVQEMVGRVRSLEARLQSCRSLVTPLLNPPPSYSSTIPSNQDSIMSTSNSNPGPMQLSNINARRPSEYMTSHMDISEE